MSFWPAAIMGGSSVLSGIGSLIAGNEAADASKDAARLNSQTQMRMFNESNRLNAPSRIAGDWMRDEQLALMGFNPTSGFSTTGAPTAGGNYVTAHSDLSNAFNTLSPENKRHLVSGGFDTDGDGQISREEFGNFHYDRHGRGEGRIYAQPASGGATGGGDRFADAGTQDAAWDRFLGGGFNRSMTELTDANMGQIVDSFGAGGAAMSGQTQEALADRLARNRNTAFTQHWNALGGGAGQSTQVAAQQGQQGMQLANALSANNNQAAQATGSSYMNAAGAFGNALQNGANTYMYGRGQGWWGS